MSTYLLLLTLLLGHTSFKVRLAATSALPGLGPLVLLMQPTDIEARWRLEEYKERVFATHWEKIEFELLGDGPAPPVDMAPANWDWFVGPIERVDPRDKSSAWPTWASATRENLRFEYVNRGRTMIELRRMVETMQRNFEAWEASR